MLDGLEMKRGLRQVSLADTCSRHRVLAVRSADTIERTMRSVHVTTWLMTGQCNLLCLCAHRAGYEFHFLDRALQAQLAEPKTNQLEHQHQIQSRGSGFDVLLMNGRTLQMKGKLQRLNGFTSRTNLMQQ